MAQLIAILKSEHQVTADDGCSASWLPGAKINIRYGEGTLDYVRKGVTVPMALENHYHTIPLINLSFFLEVEEELFPVNPVKLFEL